MNIPLMIIGIVVIYLSAVIRYVPPPFEWVIEENFPGSDTVKKIWKPGLHLLWFPIKPFMFVRNKLYCADKKILITIGVADENPGDASLVEFKDTSAGVRTQAILKVLDPIKATYMVDDYEKAALNKIEADFRRIMSTMKLDDAMSNICMRTQIAAETFKNVNKAIARWGVKLTNPGDEITIIDFVLQQSTLDDRAKILTAQKDHDAKIKNAEATRRETILIKEGEAKGIILVADAEGKGEADKVTILAKKLGLPNEQVIDYLLKLGMLKAIDGSTIIATSEGGLLNTPIGLAQTMFAINNAQAGKGGSQP
ncbi:MAG TPA: SPFH domain-containing protein [Candidatus Saccharimonadales bacterium]|nr:SPFH domain-containing protein [Candidatus Saccharimonadales bacterium]